MELATDTFDLGEEEVRRRFQSARERGLPHWLWPNVTIDRWRMSLQAIGAAIGEVLGGKIGAGLLDEDADSLSVACYTSGTGPLLGFWAEQGLISPAATAGPLLALHLAHNRLRIARMTNTASDIVDALETRGVETTILKGMHTAHAYFPEAGTRPLSDIDLLVSPSDEAAAGEVLASMGFQPGKPGRWPPQRVWRLQGTPQDPRTLCLVHADDPWSVDLQTSLSRHMAGGGRVARLEEVRHAFGRSRWVPNPRAAVLDEPLQLLHLAVHAGCGLESLTLLRMVELIMVIRRDEASGLLSWAEFLDLGQRSSALGLAYPALQCCERLSPGTVPLDVLDHCRQAAPDIVQKIVGRLEPALAHQVERCSLAERYMWADTWTLRVRQFASELIPPSVTSIADLSEIYRTRFWRLMKRTVTW